MQFNINNVITDYFSRLRLFKDKDLVSKVIGISELPSIYDTLALFKVSHKCIMLKRWQHDLN